ncbi:phage tail domain-containing protein [Cytobacillus purgationiresistens]|uniref:Phage tail family protein n=1 Tax=Cytobacillus purgationiresistens TaxID=863449 RepID=A0ABU0AC93_9BACI|nr:phage tail domain-containing protein [Cytobacillus purgationiresistens]MDQ0268870.1 hypothetical protein [Cytobacillus purgationiresistens]
MQSFRKKEKLIIENDQGQTFEISVLSPFYLDNADGLDSMENEFYTSINYDTDGENIVGSSIRPRNITIEGRISEDKEINRIKMIRFFNPRRKFTLQYTDGEISRFINFRVEKAPVISKDTYPVFVISLLCPKPWWFDREIKTDVATWVGAFSFPLIIPEDTGIQMGYREPSVIVNVNNTSDNISPLRIEFRAVGTLINPSILNVETREFIRIEKEMIAGDVISVNTERGNEYVRLSRNGVTSNIFNDLTLESNPHLSLDIGDNLMRYDADSNVDNLEITIYFTPQYVGV